METKAAPHKPRAARQGKPAHNSHRWRYNALASSKGVEQFPDELCPDCGSGFAKDLKGSGYRWHLLERPKRDPITNETIKDAQGNRIMCGGTPQSRGKGNRS
jgi:hypothetical protein